MPDSESEVPQVPQVPLPPAADAGTVPELASPARPPKGIPADYWMAGLFIVIVIAVIAVFEGDTVAGWFRGAGGFVHDTPEGTRAANGHITAGLAAYNTANFAHAEEEFRKATQADPNSALAWNDLGAALNGEGAWDAAVAALRQAIALDPTLQLARNNLAFAYAKKGQGNTPFAKNPALQHINAGMSLYNASNFAGAEAEFRHATEADPASALAWNDLGAALNSEKRWDEAIPALRRATELDPSSQLAKNNLAYALAKKAQSVGK